MISNGSVFMKVLFAFTCLCSNYSWKANAQDLPEYCISWGINNGGLSYTYNAKCNRGSPDGSGSYSTRPLFSLFVSHSAQEAAKLEVARKLAASGLLPVAKAEGVIVYSSESTVDRTNLCFTYDYPGGPLKLACNFEPNLSFNPLHDESYEVMFENNGFTKVADLPSARVGTPVVMIFRK